MPACLPRERAWQGEDGSCHHCHLRGKAEAHVKEKSGELGDASGKGWFLRENQHVLVAECTDTAAGERWVNAKLTTVR